MAGRSHLRCQSDDPGGPRPDAATSCASASAPPASSRSTPTSATRGGRTGQAPDPGLLIELKEQGLRIAGYGAPAKGNTLLNYCGVGPDLLDFTCDLNPRKQGLFLPGSHIPIRSPDALREDRPDIVLILPWNLRQEIVEQLGFIREWGGRFAARAPELTLLS